ncbi:MAG: 23S rRNA (uracil(1939)-C(5))-methyltransferase RlmD [Desulfuromonadaceae bacterium]|nr:23S rRNA (uracil(1939)-C(5))-methyltransferase RlmD [Desulfuromonadaceae bacterium]
MNDGTETEITSLVHGGAGLGQLPDGRAVFIPLSMPGDRVRYRIRKEYKRYAKAELEEVLSPSPHRVTPECRYFGVCGGCDWQMLSYSSQCEWKQLLLHQSLVHNLGDKAAAALDSFLPAVSPSGYRCRAQLKCSSVQGCFQLGFYRLGTHRVVGVDSCQILHPLIDALLSPLQRLFNKTRYATYIEQIDAAVDDSGRARMSTRLVIHYTGIDVKEFVVWLKTQVHEWEVAVFVSARRSQKMRIDARRRGRGANQGAGRLSASVHRLLCVQGDAGLKLDIGVPGLVLTCLPGDFTQVSLAQNRKLVELVIKLATAKKGTSAQDPEGVKGEKVAENIVYDLYCGVGNFALPLSLRVSEVVGVEANSGAIAQARKNAEHAAISNTRFVCADVADFLTRTNTSVEVSAKGENPPTPTTVILDPPRAGAKEVVAALPATGARRIVYVSCDQQTLMRDLKALIAAGYGLRYIRGVDMFPHTHHCEVVALLELE